MYAAGTQFCSLAYNASEWREAPRAAQVIVIALLDPNANQLSFRVRRDWVDVVGTKDNEHIRSLLTDFQQRAAANPVELFRQLCSLSRGPLQTFTSGPDLDSVSSILDREFVVL